MLPSGPKTPRAHLTYVGIGLIPNARDGLDARTSHDIREWISRRPNPSSSAEPRCAPDHRNTTLKVHVGPVSSHVANWDSVEDSHFGGGARPIVTK